MGDLIVTGSNIQWYANATGGTPLALSTALVDGTTYYASQTVSGCESDTRLVVIGNVDTTPTITITSGPSCAVDLLTYSLNVAVTEGTVTSTAGIVTNTSGNNWNIAGITSSTNIVLTVTPSSGCTQTLSVNAPNCSCPFINPPTSGGNQEYCFGEAIATLTASVGAAETIDWYDAPSAGNLLLSGNTSFTPAGPGTYYAETRSISSSCISATRTVIILTENTLPAAPTSGGNQTECEQSPIQTLTATATVPGGFTLVWYDASIGGSVIASPTLNTVGTITYYAESVNSSTGCISAVRTSVDLTIQTCTADLSLTKVVDNSNPNIGDTITFTITVTNSGPFDVSGVQVRDIIPAGLINIVATPSTGTYTVGTGIWNLSTTLLNGGSASLTISTEVSPTCTSITNSAEIISSGFADPDSTPNNGN